MTPQPKKIYLVCATGIATSTMLRLRVEAFLEQHQLPATVRQYRVAELNPSLIDADVIIATTAIPDDIRSKAPVVDGIPLVTGVGQAETLQKVLDILQSKPA
jgi:PTS system galactitol-specific IIB component